MTKNKVLFFAVLITAFAAIVAGTVSTEAYKWFSGDDDPDMPSHLSTMSKEEFMQKRAEAIGLLRGIDEKNPENFDPSLRVKAIEEMEKQISEIKSSKDDNAKAMLASAWTPIGPYPIPNGQTTGVSTAVSGRTVAIAVHPTNPDIAYVGTAQGGLYRTTDGGTTWTPLMDSAQSLAIGSVTIAPSDPETVYVGTGESAFSADSYFGVGIYRIDNASTTATLSGPFGGSQMAGRSVSEIAVDTNDKNLIFATTTSGIGGIAGTLGTSVPARGLFRSTDAASAAPTFTKIGVPTGVATEDRTMSDLVIDPSNSNKVIVAVVSNTANNSGIWTSNNALSATPTFTRTLANAGTTSSTTRTELAVTRAAGVTTFYAASALNGGTVHKSTDGGVTWTQQIDNNFCTPQCFYNIGIAVSPTDANRVYIGGSPTSSGGVPVAYSANGGTTFTRSDTGVHADTHAFAVSPSNPAIVYMGTDGGIYKSTDSGLNWTSLSNATFSATQYMSVDVHSTDPNFTIGGTQDNGTHFRKTDASWTRTDYGDGGYSAIDKSTTSTTSFSAYHTYYNAIGTTQASSLVGYAWNNSNPSAFENWAFVDADTGALDTAVLFYAPLELGPSAAGTLNPVYYGSDQLYRSTGGSNAPVTVSQAPITSGVAISAIGIAPTNDNVRIVGQANGGIWGTTTGSTTLTDMDPSGVVPNSFVARVAISPFDVNTAFVTLSAFGVTNVWKTSNLNALTGNASVAPAAPTWTASNTGLPAVPVNAFVLDTLSSKIMYAGTDIGVYASTDSGATWSPFCTGLPIVAVFDMAIAPNGKLRIATHGRGMWECDKLIAAPTAARVSLKGRVVTPAGRGLLNAAVVLTNQNGEEKIARTTASGRFNFSELEVGNYVLSVRSKKYQYQPRNIELMEDLDELTLTPSE